MKAVAIVTPELLSVAAPYLTPLDFGVKVTSTVQVSPAL
jgi:hypothetical protein